MLSTAVLVAASMAVGQAEEPNVEYEKLKVLDPLIGTWSNTWTYNEGAFKGEGLGTYSWSDSKRMITGETKVRTGKADEDLTGTDWRSGRRMSIVWNHKRQQIEWYVSRPTEGIVMIEKWLPEGEGKFKIERVSTTGAGTWTSDTRITITKDEIATKQTNRKDAEGNVRDDREFVFRRVDK